MSNFFKSVEDFVHFSGGDHAIKKILIANNGIGAIKAIRSIRRWSFETFGNERMIEFVIMATPEDMKANAEYIRMADEVVDVPGGTNNNNYANVTLICEIAERLRVDAVMPMWGHASENPNLPNSLLRLSHKVTFIGPPAEPMMALGDKIGSTIIAQSAGVPTISWNGDNLTVDYQKTGIPTAVYDEANVKTAEEALACAERIGFPVMIKASEGGGGKGIRKVIRSEDVVTAYRQVQSEIPGSPIFVMKMASKARHLEVQLLADKYGEAIALSGRDCSVQRRHQKIIEEGPPIAAPKDIFKKMEAAACALAKTVGYINAGTVEYLYMEDTQEFAFLELNPRLQVEHPVTENILGINLPACQLQVAMGLPLCRIGDIRKLYGRHPRALDTIDFQYAERQAPPRHCIAVRVTAENPDAGFQPTSGKIRELQFRSSIDVWGYFSVDNSGSIHEFADSQFGHIFAGGADRESARRAMIVALKELQIRGDIRTTIEYIIKMIQSEDFVNNRIDTAWLDGRIARHVELSIEENKRFAPAATLVATCGAALQGYKHFEKNGRAFTNMVRVGQIPSKDILANSVNIDLIYENVKYSTNCIQNGSNSCVVECNGGIQNIQIRTLADEGFLIDVGGKSHLIYATEEAGGSLRMILDGHTCIFTPEYDPTKLTSSVAGKLARLLVVDGSHVNAGDPYVEIEVMKMYMPLKALEAGTVHFQMSEGATLSPGDVIATCRLDDPDKVVKAELFKGHLKTEDEEDISSSNDASKNKKPHLRMRAARQKLDRVLDGYIVSDAEIDDAINTYILCLTDRVLPAFETEEALSVLRGRIDAHLFESIMEANNHYLSSLNNTNSAHLVQYPSGIILSAIAEYAQSLAPEKRNAFNLQISTVWNIAERYLFSEEVRILAALLKFVEGYLNVEKLFDSMSFTDVVSELRKDNPGDLDKVISLCRSHMNIKAKNTLLLKILEEMKGYPLSSIIQQRPRVLPGIPIRNDINIRNLKMRLSDLSKLRQPNYSQVAFAANVLSIEQYSMTVEGRRQRLNDAIIAALTTGEPVGHDDRVAQVKKFVESNIVIRELLLEFLRHDSDYQLAVLELYLRRVYQKTHRLSQMTGGKSLFDDGMDNMPWILFDFATRSVEQRDSSETPRKGANSDTTTRHPVVFGSRTGIIVKIDMVSDVTRALPRIIAKIPIASDPASEPVNAIHIVVLEAIDENTNDDVTANQLNDILLNQAKLLKERGVRRVTFFLGKHVKKSGGSYLEGSVRSMTPAYNGTLQLQPVIFTFRSRSQFQEDRLFRHIEAPHAFHLDLPRLENFSILLEKSTQSHFGSVHMYQGSPKNEKGGKRYFARVVSFTADIANNDMESLVVDAIDQLGVVIGREEALKRESRAGCSNNHIYVNVVVPDSIISLDFIEKEIRRISDKYWMRISRLHIYCLEIRVSCRPNVDAESITVRYIVSNPTGYVLNLDSYMETGSHGKTIFRSIGPNKGPLDGYSTRIPYETTQKFEKQRNEAMLASETLYVYDWPALFEKALENQWNEYFRERNFRDGTKPPSDIFLCEELVICDSESEQPFGASLTSKDIEGGVLIPTLREPGFNHCGMVAWLLTLRSPDFPHGRQIVVIANDITHQAGSFGTKEDMMFFKASEYARVRSIPRLYLAANSGARIGMAQSLKALFQVCFNDDKDPSKGFRYIYLTQDAYDSLLAKYNGNEKALPVICSPLTTENGTVRYVITDIIGEESDLGVENLMGSGLIAGETSRAYDEIFTLTLVVGRTVGIGAYLVRLGQRTIQKTRSSPIILTGYQALNKLMGREIYTTNDQLGGPMIMFPNGVSHMLAETHMDSVTKAMQWLSFVPEKAGRPVAIRCIEGLDEIERTVDFAPPKGLPFDPRLLLSGEHVTDRIWRSGFLDKNSFVEYLSGWAKTVVVGRGRLGGIPVGIIVTENRTSEACKPADPADVTSQERMVQQAGGVWFPDSAYKTAQALKDFDRESLPCFVFANWRGFSGGQRDMFDEVLKFGSMIVDALVAYRQPLFVYIPPFSELRGGAWVVVDSTINAETMEFYAAETARGGVLEATGAASIKYRDRDIIATSHRVDETLKMLDSRLAALKGNSQSSEKEIKDVEKQIKQREKLLFGVYQQIAVHFADLHDTPGRMQAKGVIRQQVDWRDSRTYFFWRLKRRLQEFDVVKKVTQTSEEKGNARIKTGYRKDVMNRFYEFISAKIQEQGILHDDKAFATWFESNEDIVQQFVLSTKQRECATTIKTQLKELLLLAKSTSDASSVIGDVFSQLSEEEVKLLKTYLK